VLKNAEAKVKITNNSADFVDRVHGTGFLEIRPWRPLSAIPVEIVDVVAGTDGSWYR